MGFASNDSVEAVANAVGYEDAGFFSRLFRRNVRLTPAQYRRRFGGLRRALQESRPAGGLPRPAGAAGGRDWLGRGLPA